MMQSRSLSRRKHDVVRIALALQEHEHRIFTTVWRNVFGQTKAEPHIKLELLAHIGNQNLKMIDSLRHRATMMAEIHQQSRPGLHRSAEFKRHAARIAHMQRLALIWPLDPLRRQARLLEIGLCFHQIFFSEATHADALGFRRIGALEHQAVVAGFGNAAEIDRVLVFIANDQADQIGIKRAAFREVLDVQHGMAGACNIERRIVIGLR